uniref:Uncharacterized protein n=1 Tax=Cacopsylla melanoneura TaxID=428564 RepID=A0A8D8LKQ1_9HEMI
MKEMEKLVRAIEMEGLLWGASKLGLIVRPQGRKYGQKQPFLSVYLSVNRISFSAFPSPVGASGPDHSDNFPPLFLNSPQSESSLVILSPLLIHPFSKHYKKFNI